MNTPRFNSEKVATLTSAPVVFKRMTRAALRYKGLFLPIDRAEINMRSAITESVLAFVSKLKDIGFAVSEELLHALNDVEISTLEEITRVIDDVMGVNLNWAALVKGWDVPTGEGWRDHMITLIANCFGASTIFRGTKLPCGHVIPEGTFPIERYTGCPFCGRQFETSNFVYKGQGSKLKELRLLTLEDMYDIFKSMLTSKTPLDATQKESLEILLEVFPLPENPEIGMKETVMLAIRTLGYADKEEEILKLLKTPTDILRYLWYEKTGYVQIIRPRTLISQAHKVNTEMLSFVGYYKSKEAGMKMKEQLRLKYGRYECLRVAKWINALPMTAESAAEMMHPHRGMWVRMIRALRLGEYSRKKGFGHLKAILDVFYNERYTTWQGRVDKARLADDPEKMLELLKQRPGLFARCLFATMLRFGPDRVLTAFREIADKLPTRLLLSLGNVAEYYFLAQNGRVVRPVMGGVKQIPSNPLLADYRNRERLEMVVKIEDLFRGVMKKHFADEVSLNEPSDSSRTIYIDPRLYNIPVSVGDRATTIQDTSCALQGTHFPVEGNAVRIFLQWGKGLPAQHLDMDISCRLLYKDGHETSCAYFNLVCDGAKHSGDIQRIPDMVGTAEYIELSLPVLKKRKVKYVVFTCNAFTGGSLSPNLVVGWMNSAYPMEVSDETGVAYDPSCVQHFVRISESDLSKGLVFGVLDVDTREIIWLEMPFTSQTVGGLNMASVESLLERLANKMSIGELLDLKAEAQGQLKVTEPEDATEAYTYEWALNPASVTQLL